MVTIKNKSRSLLVCFALAILTGIAYWHVAEFDFVNYDDNIYVYENPHIQNGFTQESVKWSFSTDRTGNWHPVTWLSLMIDQSLYGMNPGRFHLTNLLLHLLSTLLLFLVLSRLTGTTLRSAFVAALFALHPMHVESVAWIAERKDVLSTLFWILAMGCYGHYSRSPSVGRMLAVTAVFALGLMAKPMLVTLPCVLLLCDYWPLDRFRLFDSAQIQGHSQASRISLIAEKLPLFFLTVLSSGITLLVQQQGRNVAGMADISFSARLANASSAYYEYLYRLLWPVDLAVLYPLQENVPVWKPLIGCAILIAVTALALRWRRRRPYFIIGWLWYVGTMVPVIGLIQVGNQYIADRYTYVPYIGLFIIIAWGAHDLLRRFTSREIWFPALACLVLLPLLPLCRTQVGYWKDSMTLFTHTLAVTRDNFLIQNNMGAALIKAGRQDEAIIHFKAAVSIRPDYETPLNNLGLVYTERGRKEEAIEYYRRALAVDGRYAAAHYNLANALLEKDDVHSALEHYRAAVECDPDYVVAIYNYGRTLAQTGRVNEALDQYLRLLEIDPNMAKAHNDLGNILMMRGDMDKAIQHYKKAISLDAGYGGAYHNLGIAMMRKREVSTAILYFEKAVELSPQNRTFRETLSKAQSYR